MMYRDHPSFIDQKSVEDFQFIGEDFSDRKFKNINFISGSFHHCNFGNATFIKCSFGGVSFSDCNVDGLSFDASECGFTLSDGSPVKWPADIAYT